MFTTFLLIVTIGYVNGLAATTGKIVGGHPVNITDYPYQVLMLWFDTQWCGGSIISSNWVLTAAHCLQLPIQYNYTEYITFRAGSANRDYGGQIHNKINIVMHPKYNSTTFDYDFALVKVSPSFNIGTPGINIVRVGMIEPSAGINVSVSGWGTTSPGGTPSAILLAADIKIVQRSVCYTNYSGDITSSMICAAASGMDSCQGDSGGPLVIRSINILVGVVSFGISCADPSYPGVYSNVAVARMWIYRVTGV